MVQQNARPWADAAEVSGTPAQTLATVRIAANSRFFDTIELLFDSASCRSRNGYVLASFQRRSADLAKGACGAAVWVRGRAQLSYVGKGPRAGRGRQLSRHHLPWISR